VGAFDVHARALPRDADGGAESDEERGHADRGPDPSGRSPRGARVILGSDPEEAGALMSAARDDLALLLGDARSARHGRRGCGLGWGGRARRARRGRDLAGEGIDGVVTFGAVLGVERIRRAAIRAGPRGLGAHARSLTLSPEVG